MKKILSVIAATALCLALAVAAQASTPLCRYTAPDGTELELLGVAESGENVLVAVISKENDTETAAPLGIPYDPRYEPELAPAAPTGGAPNEVLLRVFAGGGSGVHIEELYLLRPYAGGVDVAPFEHDLLTRLASELVDIRAEGGKVSFVRSDKAGDAGSVLFSADADAPLELGGSDSRASVFSSQVRYRFGDDGRAIACISPVPTLEGGMPMYFDEEIEFDVHVTASGEERSFSLSDPRLGKTAER